MKSNDEIYMKFAHELADSIKDEIKSFTHEKKGFFNRFYSLFLK